MAITRANRRESAYSSYQLDASRGATAERFEGVASHAKEKRAPIRAALSLIAHMAIASGRS
jgi:hypothetical protein